ncbi:MAG TPA: TRAP transporter substrate-binding protein [Xanthobacteraceae bacterium]|jgi:TRAP-type C4-dicarboxylate transport system substrate-binding protein|nr:TRAP transporter substrate-binding protein [Xanthobacteraceae bacterium]
MEIVKKIRAGRLFVAASVLSFALAGPALAQDKTYTMKITLPTLNDPSHVYAKNFAAAVEKDSGGRIKTEIYPASQLGAIPRQIEGVQFGAIQCAVIPPEFFVGVDERFEVMAAPGLVNSMTQGQKLAADPAVQKLMFSLGAEKGLHGVAMFMNAQQSVISKAPIRHLPDFKGKKVRVLASPFQMQSLQRLGATPVAMTLGDVMPALQQGTIDGAVGGIVVWTPMHYVDAAKYVTETGQPAVYAIVEVSKSWYESLPDDLKKIVDNDAAAQQAAIAPIANEIFEKARKGWSDAGGELISLPADEQADMMKLFASVGADVSKTKPALEAAYKTITEAAARLQ